MQICMEKLKKDIPREGGIWVKHPVSALRYSSLLLNDSPTNGNKNNQQ